MTELSLVFNRLQPFEENNITGRSGKNVSSIPAIAEVCFSTLRTLICKVLLYYSNKAAATMTSSDLVVILFVRKF